MRNEEKEEIRKMIMRGNILARTEGGADGEEKTDVAIDSSNIIEYQHCKKNCQQIQQRQRNKTMLTLRSSAPLRYPG